ncbi:MAG TPA: polyisoprenoid-binding protein [Bacteroidetes bacterium]|nr:polyisoprenoid-binding protein [Bacteroidota bacterium]
MLFVAICGAQTAGWKLDKSHSQVTFSVAHLVISEVRGVFKEFDVDFSTASEDFTDATIDATIKTASIDSGIEARDKHLRADDFLGVEKYPDMKFKSTKIEKAGSDTYKITGDLTIREVTKTVVLDTKYKGSIKDPWGNEKMAFRATTTIDRLVFGTKWNKATETGGLVAGREVEITLLMEFTKQK